MVAATGSAILVFFNLHLRNQLQRSAESFFTFKNDSALQLQGGSQARHPSNCDACGKFPETSKLEQDPFIGKVIGRQFELESVLGTGSWSRVYKATRVHDGESVAIKLMHSGLVLNVEARKRFEREAEAGQLLHHPNICRTFSAGLHEDRPFIVMECLRGTTLQLLMKRLKRIDVKEALRIVIECCDGLHYAHSMGLLHRDVKPANILYVKTES